MLGLVTKLSPLLAFVLFGKRRFKMAYLQKINDLLEATILKNTTSKILQHMSRIRNASSVAQARRWVMELIQNARDVAFEDGILICITLTDDKLIFEHNGKPFRVKDVLSIINQASSKDDSIEAVGKFGTGFVTTFQLSETVVLKSILWEEGEEAIPFEIVLDRSGKNDVEIEQSILSSMTQLRECVSQNASCILEKDNYNTGFIYDLVGEYEKNIAQVGLVDLKNAINEILLFSEKIKEILVVIDTKELKKTVHYRSREENVLSGIHNIKEKIFEWKTCENGEESRLNHKLIYITEGSLSLALAVDFERNILAVDAQKSRVFVDFPLIGSENFPFPVIINDRRLHPNEPRSGISLVDSERSEEAKLNKEIIKKCVHLYHRLFQYLYSENYGNLWNFLRIPIWQDSPEMSSGWVRENIYNSLYRVFYQANIIETNQGMSTPINRNLRFPWADTMQEKEEIYWLLSQIPAYWVAKNNVNWYDILQGYLTEEIGFRSVSLPYILENIHQYLHRIEKNSAFAWVNYLYLAAMRNESYATQIRSGKISIYPSQSPRDALTYRHLNSFSMMKRDISTDGMLREIAELLFGEKQMSDFRFKLVDRDFMLTEDGLEPFDDGEMATHINTCITYLITYCHLDELRESTQIGCARLAEWIDITLQEKPNLAKEYFPGFCSEEGRAKLLTSKAVAAISKQLREVKHELSEVVEENQRLQDMIKKLKQESEGTFHFGDVVILESELEAFGEAAEERLRQIGLAGEEYAYKRLLDFYESDLSEGESLMAQYGLVKNEELTYQVIRPDTENYKQPGYDIKVLGKNGEGKTISTDYFEVKTHTTGSCVKKLLNLSEEQMKMAMKKKENYHALKIHYLLQEQECVDMEIYQNLISKISTGQLKHTEKGYSYYCN